MSLNEILAALRPHIIGPSTSNMVLAADESLENGAIVDRTDEQVPEMNDEI